MPALRNKTILILSPQAWGKMFLSKHHYAIELARRGNKVYFLNPPRQEPGKAGVTITPSVVDKNLLLIDHGLWFPYNLKFHLLPVFHFLMRGHIKKLLRAIGEPVDIVWSFDLGNLYPFGHFPAGVFRLFHPVDEPLNRTAIDSGKGCQVVFSVTQEILEKYRVFKAPGHLINHGLADSFLIPVDVHRHTADPPRVGMSGNLLRGDIDRETFLQVIRDNPRVLFECWGSFSAAQSNIAGDNDDATRQFITSLQAMPNVTLHGAVSTDRLAAAIHDMDVFLICYDIKKDQSGGTNYHKIMEYLSTGKVIVSNNVTAFKDREDLIQMVRERDNNHELPALFKKVIDNLGQFNGPHLQQHRIDYSRDNTYRAQLGRIETLLEPLL